MLNNIFTRKVANTKTISFKPLTENADVFNETELLDFMVIQEMTMSTAVIEHTRYTYLGEREDCMEIVRESAGDFFDKVAEFFKNLLKKIKEWFGKLFLLIQSLLGKTKTLIENHKEALLKKQASFTIEGYTYSTNSSPNLTALENLVSTYNKEFSTISKMQLGEIKEKRSDFMDSLPKLRGEILGSKTRIDDGELKEEADKFYRDGDSDTNTITVDNGFIAKICSEYSTLDKIYGDCVKEKRKLEVQLEGLKKYFETGARQVRYVDGDKRIEVNQVKLKDSGVMKQGDGHSIGTSSGTLRVLNAYFDFKYAESKELSNIVLTVVDARARALKDQLKMYDACIRRWINVKPDNIKGKEDDND